MASPSFWERFRRSRLVRVLVVYLGASWGVLQVTNELHHALGLPDWVAPLTVLLLLVGLLVTIATAWVQSRPGLRERAAAEEVPSAWELDLKDAMRSVSRGRVPHLTWGRALAGGALAFQLLFGIAVAYVVFRGGAGPISARPAAAAEAPDGVAVLPFTVSGAGLAQWREGIADLLATGLDGAAGLRAIASRTVLARWNELARDSTSVDERLAMEVAKRTGARYAILGSAVAIGPRVRLVADVRELDTGAPLGQAQEEGSPDSVLVLLDGLAVQSLGFILRREHDLPEVDLTSLTTSSLTALKAYLAGDRRFRQGEFEAAAQWFEKATQEDSLFALAYAQLAQAYGWSESIGSTLGSEAGARALALVDRLPAREALLVRAATAVASYPANALSLAQQATQRYPDDAQAWYLLGEAYIHDLASLGSWEEAEPAFRRAVDLAPTFAPYRIHLIDAALRYRADSTATEEALRAYERLAPGSAAAKRYRLAATLAFGSGVVRDSALGVAIATYRGDPVEVRQLLSALAHPRFTEIRERIAEGVLPRLPPDAASRLMLNRGADEIFAPGHIRRGIELLRAPRVPAEARRMVLQGFTTVFPDVDSLVDAEARPAQPGAARLSAQER